MFKGFSTMTLVRFHALSLAIAVAFCLAQVASAATVGLWQFDTMTDVTYATASSAGDPPGGETLFDSSGNNLNFVSSQDFGSYRITWRDSWLPTQIRYRASS
jgi:hypothetical protein